MEDKADAANDLSIPSDAVCWVCLDNKDEQGKQLWRPCACRGEGGACHVSCIAKFAETKRKQAGSGVQVDAWVGCVNCGQPWFGEFGLQIAQMRYEQYKGCDTSTCGGFHDLRDALLHYAEELLGRNRVDEAIELSQRVYDLDKTKCTRLGVGSFHFEWIVPWQFGETCNLRGGCLLKKGRYDEALLVFEEGRDVCDCRDSNGELSEENRNRDATLLNNIAEVYAKKGDAKKALKLRKQALDKREKLHGKNSREFTLVCLVFHTEHTRFIMYVC